MGNDTYEDLKKAHEVLEQLIRDNPQLEEAYEAREKWERDYISRIDEAYKEGFEEEFEKGKKIGIEEGIKEQKK